MIEWIFFGVAILFVIVILFFTFQKSPMTNINPPPIEEQDGMTVYNHLQNCHLKIDFLKFENNDYTKPTGIVHSVTFREKTLIPISLFDSKICGNSVIRVSVLPDAEKGKELHFTDVQLNAPPGTMFRRLHVGTITTRIIGAVEEQLNSAENQGLATMGSTFLRIHNTTNIPLTLNNGKIEVPPQDYLRFRGYQDMGVPLGMYFKDDRCLFPTYQLLKPFSDLYFGVVSENNQPLNGTYQHNFSTEVDYGQTIWPFQDGIM